MNASSHLNVVVLRGTIASDVLSRQLPSGSCAVQFDVRTVTTESAGDGAGGSANVPISWIDPPASGLAPLVVGESVVVIGSVRRRFFRAGGITQSRTEVVAVRVVPERRAKSAQSAISAAIRTLGD
jgi:single-strand DNA-binding protein